MNKIVLVSISTAMLWLAMFAFTPNSSQANERDARYEPNGRGQDIGPLFEAPTAAELAVVKADWAARDVRALDWQVLGEADM